jgi:UDP-N-acetylmuramyl tripeptide synthase
VPGLLREGLLAGGVPAEAIVCIPDHEEALRHILSEARAGDLVVINTSLTDKVTATIDNFDAGRGKSSAGWSFSSRDRR